MAEGENLTSSQEQDHTKPTSNAFGAPCMTITISDEKTYFDREPLSDQILPSLTPFLTARRPKWCDRRAASHWRATSNRLPRYTVFQGFVFALLIYCLPLGNLSKTF